MFNGLRTALAPRLDPPDGETVISNYRKLTRDRTPWTGPDEYVCTVDLSPPEVRRALERAGYRANYLSTLKYVDGDAGLSWEQFSVATNRWDRSCDECQQHCYGFRAADGGTHLHHHREYPVAQPDAHQNGSRTHGDPDGRLTDALERAGIAHETAADPTYRPADPYDW